MDEYPRSRYFCPKRTCDWTHEVGLLANPAAVETVLELHIATHPIWRRIMARRVRQLRARQRAPEGVERVPT